MLGEFILHAVVLFYRSQSAQSVCVLTSLSETQLQSFNIFSVLCKRHLCCCVFRCLLNFYKLHFINLCNPVGILD
jgi:hypothetical protein